MKNSKNKKEKKRQSIRHILQNNLFILKIAFKESPLASVMSIILSINTSLIVFLKHTLMIVYVVDCIQYEKPFSYAAFFIVSLFIYESLTNVLYNLYYSKWRAVGEEKIFRAVHIKLYEKARNMDLASYDEPEFFNDFIWSMNNAEERVGGSLWFCSEWFGKISALIIAGGYILFIDPMCFVFVAVSFFVSTYLRIKISKLNYSLDSELNPVKRKASYISRVFYLLEYAKEMRLSGVKKALLNDYSETQKQMGMILKKYSRKIAVLDFIRDYFQNSFIFDYVFLLYLMYITVVNPILGFGAMFGLYNSSRRLKSIANEFSWLFSNTQENSLYIEKMRKFMDNEPSIFSKDYAVRPENGDLQFKNVSFLYPGTKEKSLDNVSFTVKKGEKIAIVGYNGAGKTTLIKLLMRLYDTNQGEILLNGINIKEYDLIKYRNLYTVLFQDYQIYAATVTQNIVAGMEPPDEKQLEQALILSGFAKKAQSMKNAEKTLLTREFEEGEELSGGEKQKLATARALYKNSPILILDEPSSALDPVAEYELNNTLLRLSQDKTIIFISHRLSTTKMADRILMFENGRLIEQGSHNELMNKNGKYAEMFTVQAEKYRNVAIGTTV